MACRTSAAYVAGGNARAEWESDRFPKEDRDAEHELMYGGRSRLPRCSTPRPSRTSVGPGERTRFGQYARRLWGGLMAARDVADQ